MALKELKCQAELRVFNLNTNKEGGGTSVDGKHAAMRKAFDIVAQSVTLKINSNWLSKECCHINLKLAQSLQTRGDDKWKYIELGEVGGTGVIFINDLKG